MLKNTPVTTDFKTALNTSFSHLRDVSVRDGIQSWDANKWKIDDIIPVVKELNALALVAKENGASMAPVEAWGGNQFSGPVDNLGEDPFENLKRIKEAAPDLLLQSLYRGRQAYGFIPVSQQVQRAGLKASVDGGVRVVRIFDMMNDITNVTTGIDILKRLKQDGDKVKIEGAISYISEPKGTARAWGLQDYADYAVALVKAGAAEIAIKNYAGVDDKEMPALVRAIRSELRKVGHADIKVNLHAHGDKADVLAAAVAEGADKVDVAFGDLARGTSHSDAIETLKALMKDKGFDIDANPELQTQFEANAIVQQMHKVEQVIAERATEYKKKRGRALTQTEMDNYRMAGGALSTLWSKYIPDQKAFEQAKQYWENENKKRKEKRLPEILSDDYGDRPSIPATKEEWYKDVLDVAKQLWEKAGRFNTVTPGADILSTQAVKITNARLSGRELNMTDYTPEYLNVIRGRYGRNQGVEKGIGDTEFHNAALMFGALQTLNDAVINNKISGKTAKELVAHASFGEPGNRPMADKNGYINLTHPSLEKVLKASSLDGFIDAVNSADIPAGLKEKMRFDLSREKTPEPVNNMEEAQHLVSRMGHKIAEIRAAGKPLSENGTLVALAALLTKKDPYGKPDNRLFLRMIESLRTGKRPGELKDEEFQLPLTKVEAAQQPQQGGSQMGLG